MSLSIMDKIHIIHVTDKQPQYEQVIFLQGDAGAEALECYDADDGSLLDYLSQWHFPGEHDVSEEPGYGTFDQITEKDGYILSVNYALGYCGLVWRLT